MVRAMFKSINKNNFIQLSKINILYSNSARAVYRRKKNKDKYIDNPNLLYRDLLLMDNLIVAIGMIVVFSLVFSKMPFDIVPGMIDTFILMFTMLTLIQGFTSFYNVFYESKDVAIMRTLPVTQKEVFYSKLTISSLRVFSSGLPLFVLFYYFMQKNGFGYERIGYALGITIILNIVMVLMNIGVMQMLALVSSGTLLSKRLINIVSGVSQVGTLIVTMVLGEMNKSDSLDIIKGQSGVLSTLLLDSKALVIFIAVSILILLVLYFIVDKLIASKYYYNIINYEEKKTGKSKSKKARSIPSDRRTASTRESLLGISFKYNLRLLMNNSTLISSSLITPLILPVIYAFTTVRDFAPSISTQGSDYGVVAGIIIGIASGVLVNINPTNLPSIMFSVEGYNYEYIKSIPYNKEEYYRSKMIFSSIITSILPSILIVAVGIILKIGVVPIAIALVVFLTTNIVATNIWLAFDLKNISTDWQNITELYGRFSRGLSFVLIFGVLFLLVILSSIVFYLFQLYGGAMAIALTLILWAIICLALILISKKKISKYLH